MDLPLCKPAALDEAAQREDAPPRFRVALVAMPFLATQSPSIQLGLLKAIVAEHGFDVSTLHVNLDFAAQIGYVAYDSLCACGPNRLGEWLFARAAFATAAPDAKDALLDDLTDDYRDRLAADGLTRERLLAIRHVETEIYLDRLLAAVPWSDFAVVGFTSSFEQNAASFALARRLKARYPALVTIFGGANCDGDMGREWVRRIDAVDFAVVGEGDQALPELLKALQSGSDPALVPGVICRRDGEVTPMLSRPLTQRMDASPIPDYHEYFARLDALAILPASKRRAVRVPFEGARGCWWGAKHHCTFCGLNGSSMTFRSKSPDKVIGELAELARRHGAFNFFAVDNIVDTGYFKSFFPALRAAGSDYEFFFEVKSNLTRAQVRILHEGGVRQMQPGIESLSTPVLRLMRKGVSGIQNVNLLRWARYYDIHVGWNLLYGFPGETAEDYAAQNALMPLLTHLQPPNSRATRIAMQRFSPIHADRQTFPVRWMRPSKNYTQVYPANVNLDDAVYYLDYELENTLPESAYDDTYEQVQRWRNAWEAPRRPRMIFRHAPGFVEIEDRRKSEQPRAYRISGIEADLYAACSDEPHSPSALQRLLKLDWEIGRIEAALQQFQSLGLAMREDQRYLSLALPASRGR